MSRICLLTPGQPSINPRLVKEADALVEAGHEVHVLCSHCIAWADVSDGELLRHKKWKCTYVGGKPGSWLFRYTRLRHAVIRRLPGFWKAGRLMRAWALTRVTSELEARAIRLKADFYIAHYTGALTAAVAASRKNRALVGFDAEDLESGYYSFEAGPSPIDRLTEEVEREYLPKCSYITAASPGIAETYRGKYSIPLPTTVLNVFPLAQRTSQFRSTDNSGPLRLYWFSQTVGLGRGLEDVIGAMGRLAGCDIQLHLRGRCDPETRQALVAFAAEAGIAAEKIAVYEPAAADEMVELSADYDIGLALERVDSENHDLCLSNKIFTYLLAGNAIAATITCGQESLMKEFGISGFTYEPGKVDALAAGLRNWYENRNLLDEARRASWHWGSTKFNWDREKKKFLEVVERALNREMRATSSGGQTA
jgi:glycosyltransferase involved in cell wall biosynthesis